MMHTTSNDHFLLAEYRSKGTAAAFAELVRRHRDFVYCVCLRELGQAHLAEDATQAAFLVLARRASTIRTGIPLRSWLFSVARLCARDVRKREMRQIALAQSQQSDGISAQLPNSLGDDLNEALARLQPTDRELVLRKFVDGASFAEAGQDLGISEEAARKRVNRTLLKLRQSLAHLGNASTVTSVIAILSTFVTPSASHELSEQLTAIAGPSMGGIVIGNTSASLQSLTKGVIQTMRIAQMKAAAGVAAVAVIGGTGAVSIASSQIPGISPVSARAETTSVSPVDALQQFMNARDQHNAAAMIAMLMNQDSWTVNEQSVSDGSIAKPPGWDATPEKYSAVSELLLDANDKAGYGYKIIGPDPNDPLIVDVQVAPPGNLPAAVIHIVTKRTVGGRILIDFMQSLALNDPNIKRKLHEKALQTQSMSNMKAIGLAVMMYMQAHDEHFPHAASWTDEISPYLKDKSVLHDPADQPSHRYSYAFNAKWSGAYLAKLESPSQAVLLFESNSGKKNASDHGASIARPGRHSGGSIFCFCDGHVKWFRDGALPSLETK